jgi:hypothetical protein
MKRFIIIAMLTAIMPLAAMAQHEEDTENGVVSLAGREGFTIETKKGDFVFKPYLLVQTSANFNWYDDEGLDKAYLLGNVFPSFALFPLSLVGCSIHSGQMDRLPESFYCLRRPSGY